jgi:hypothetical protein
MVAGKVRADGKVGANFTIQQYYSSHSYFPSAPADGKLFTFLRQFLKISLDNTPQKKAPFP